MRFSQSFLDEIRDRVPISAVVGSRVTFDRKKTNAAKGDHWACCPFHGENTPSFHCEDRKGRYHCFGCGVSGDHFRFLTELDGMPFPEAVERIADMAGVPLPARDEAAEKRDKQRATLHDVMGLAADFFEEKLQAAAGASARAYLRDRGLSSVTQRTFRLGHAPNSRNALKEHLASKGATKDQIEACGLVVFGPDVPVSFDRFRDRIMFPIEDTRGRVIAFGGRALSADVPAKYLNSPETDLFHKGNVLYNHGRARKAAQDAGTLIVAEGYMDVIALAQAGISNAVAPLGTALTENQLDLLWRVTGEPVLCFDGDAAGQKAAWRSADLALPVLKPGRSLRFALMPEGKDPDDIVSDGGAEAFNALIKEARPLADLLWMRETTGGVFDTPERRAELERVLKDLTGRIGDESVRRHYGQDMRERIQSFFGSGRDQRSFEKGGGQRQGRQGRNGNRSGMAGGRFAVSDSLARSALVRTAAGAMPTREAVLLVALVNYPMLVDESFESVERLELDHPDLKRLFAVLMNVYADGPDSTRDTVLDAIEGAGFAPLFKQAETLVKRAREWTALEGAALDDVRDGFRQALYLHQRARALHRELKAAEEVLATDSTEANYQHFLEVQRQLENADATEALIEGFGVASGRGGQNS